MRQFIGTTLVALIIGIGIGLLIGWRLLPIQNTNSPMCLMSSEYQEDYTLMIARGYQSDGDRDGALRNLLPLTVGSDPACEASSTQIDNVPAWVQELTERYRTRGAELEDICHLASLSAAFGRQIPGYGDRPGTVCDPFIAS